MLVCRCFFFASYANRRNVWFFIKFLYLAIFIAAPHVACEKSDCNRNSSVAMMSMHEALPEKYKTALTLLRECDGAGFVDFASKCRLDYDACNVSGSTTQDRTLFEVAIRYRNWQCVDFMLPVATPTWLDVAKSYGRANPAMSQEIWRKFVEANGRCVPATIRSLSCRSVPLIQAFALESAHVSLVKMMFAMGFAKNPVIVGRDFGSNLPLPLWYLTEPMQTSEWTSELFMWMTKDYTMKELGIEDAHIENVLRHWANDGDNLFAWDEDPRCPNRANDFEIVFWKLQSMHTDAARFAEFAKKIQAGMSERFPEMLACIGVVPVHALQPDLTANVPCSHCNGTGKVIGIDADLAQDAKKRRIEKLASKVAL